MLTGGTTGPAGSKAGATHALTCSSAPETETSATDRSTTGGATGIGDILVQGRGDRLRIFPAVPDHWRDIASRDLLAEGAFRVPALRREGQTVWARLRATADRPLRLRDPSQGEEVTVEGCEVRRKGEDLVAEMKAGQVATFALRGLRADLDEAIRMTRWGNASRLGLSAR